MVVPPLTVNPENEGDAEADIFCGVLITRLPEANVNVKPFPELRAISSTDPDPAVPLPAILADAIVNPLETMGPEVLLIVVHVKTPPALVR